MDGLSAIFFIFNAINAIPICPLAFSGSTLFGTDEFSSVPFLYMMTIKKDNYPKKYTHGNCPKKGIKSS